MVYRKKVIYYYFIPISLCIVFFLSIFSCSLNNKYSFYVIFDNVECLSRESIIAYKGIKIGEIKNMKLFNDKVIIKIEVANDIKISKQAKFYKKERGLLSCCIDVEDINTSSNFIKEKDTLIGIVNESQNTIKKIIDAEKAFN